MSSSPQFPKAFKGDIITPEHPQYQDSIKRWATNAQRNAAVVAFVKDSEDVALAIKYARDNGLEIAIRGGGHSSSGASSTEGGLVVDLSKYLNGCTVDPEKRLAYVGGGCLWEGVDKEAIKHGLASVGGTVNHTGVGGLTLGGGNGYLMSEHGLVIDNLESATIVTADGSILTASLTENSDLFWGIRGGGSNFGVCTQFVLRLHPQRTTVYAGTLVFAPTILERLVEITRKKKASGPHVKEGMLQVLTIGPDGNPVVIIIVFFNGSEADGRIAFKEFLDLGPLQDGTGEIPFESVNAMLNPLSIHGQYTYMTTTAHSRPNFSSFVAVHAKLHELVKRSSIAPAVIMEFYSLEKAASIPAGDSAFRRDEANTIIMMFRWTEGEENLQTARKVTQEIKQIFIAGQEGLMTEAESLGYGNSDPDGVVSETLPLSAVTERVKLAFGDNYPRLQSLKKKYDPDLVFSKWFPIVPAD